MYTLIVKAKLNAVDPQAWLADVLARIAATQVSRLPELLPWAWAVPRTPDRRIALAARLKITLKGVEPQIVRQIEIPLRIRLDRLHEIIQAAMGWTDCSLYEFRASGVGWAVPGECHLLCRKQSAHAGKKEQRGPWQRRSTTTFWTSC